MRLLTLEFALVQSVAGDKNDQECKSFLQERFTGGPNKSVKPESATKVIHIDLSRRRPARVA